jgi:hypothetical protein
MRSQSIISALLYVVVIAVVVAIPVYYWQEMQDHPPSREAPARKQTAWTDGYNIYLTAKEENGVPVNQAATTFSCGDKIYGVIEIDRPNDDQSHVLNAVWRNPRGADQERTKYPFQLIAGGARLWVWIKLHRSAEAAAVKFLNPSAGMEEFIGEWEIEISVDEKTIAKKNFEVIC